MIIREHGARTLIQSNVLPPTQTLFLVYTGPVGAWCHYSSFQRFDNLSTANLNLLHSFRPDELIQIQNDFCTVTPIAPDGNCLFAAVAHQLFPSSDPSIQSQHVKRIRSMAGRMFMIQFSEIYWILV